MKARCFQNETRKETYACGDCRSECHVQLRWIPYNPRRPYLSIDEGEWTAILGANGSGKTSLVRLFNALLPLTSGTIEVFGMPVVQPKNHPLLRRIVGMVFQNPEEQCVAPIVEEDISFGLENYQIPEEEIEPRTEEALRNVGLAGFASRNMASLSGGQLRKWRSQVSSLLIPKSSSWTKRPRCLTRRDVPT